MNEEDIILNKLLLEMYNAYPNKVEPNKWENILKVNNVPKWVEVINLPPMGIGHIVRQRKNDAPHNRLSDIVHEELKKFTKNIGSNTPQLTQEWYNNLKPFTGSYLLYLTDKYNSGDLQKQLVKSNIIANEFQVKFGRENRIFAVINIILGLLNIYLLIRQLTHTGK